MLAEYLERLHGSREMCLGRGSPAAAVVVGVGRGYAEGRLRPQEQVAGVL